MAFAFKFNLDQVTNDTMLAPHCSPLLMSLCQWQSHMLKLKILPAMKGLNSLKSPYAHQFLDPDLDHQCWSMIDTMVTTSTSVAN